MSGNKNNLITPQGYFEELKERLSGIPGQKKPGFTRIIAPYIAYAAALALMVAVGNYVFGHAGNARASREDIVSYLEEDGLTLEDILAYEEDY